MKKIFCIIVICCVVLVSVGCKSDRKLFNISYDLKEEPRNLDPQTATDTASLNVINNVLEGLFVYDSNGKIKNAIATDYTVSNDKTTYTFRLREDAKWNDDNDDTPGIPITAHDFAFTFQRLFQPETNSSWAKLYYSIKNAQAIHEGDANAKLGVTARDNYTLEIQLEYPNENLIALLANTSAMPCNEEFFYNTKGKYGLEVNSMMYNGPFKLARWNHKENMRLEANELYYEKEQIAPTSISLWIATKTSEQLKKEIDTATTIDNTVDRLLDETIAASIVDGFMKDNLNQKGFNTEPIQNSTWGIAFNLNQPQLNNRNIRIAIASVFDRTLYQHKLPESLDVANAIVPHSVLLGAISYRKFAGEQMTHSVDKAKAFEHYTTGLSELNQTKVTGIRLLVPKYENVQLSEYFMYVSQVIQRELGIFIGIDEVSLSEYNKQLKAGNFDIALTNLAMTKNSPHSFLEQFASDSPLNYYGYHSEEVDRDLNQAAAQLNGNAAAPYYQKAEQKILEDAVFIPMFYKTDYFVINQSVKNIVLHQQTGLVSFRYATKK